MAQDAQQTPHSTNPPLTKEKEEEVKKLVQSMFSQLAPLTQLSARPLLPISFTAPLIRQESPEDKFESMLKGERLGKGVMSMLAQKEREDFFETFLTYPENLRDAASFTPMQQNIYDEAAKGLGITAPPLRIVSTDLIQGRYSSFAQTMYVSEGALKNATAGELGFLFAHELKHSVQSPTMSVESQECDADNAGLSISNVENAASLLQKMREVNRGVINNRIEKITGRDCTYDPFAMSAPQTPQRPDPHGTDQERIDRMRSGKACPDR